MSRSNTVCLVINMFHIFTFSKSREISSYRCIILNSLLINEGKNVHDIFTVAFHQNNLRGIYEEYTSMCHLFVITIIPECSLRIAVTNIYIISSDYVLL